MSLIEKDILKSNDTLIFSLITKCDKNKIMNVFNNLTDGIKNLYLADEPSKLVVIRCNKISKSNLNNTYDCLLGYFSFENDDLVYIRNITGEKEEVELNSNILLPHQLEEIKAENNNTEKQLHAFDNNEYHKKARQLLHNRITIKFNQLSTLIFDVLNKLIVAANNQLDLDLGYEASDLANKLFQETESKLATYSLEEQIDLIKKINEMIKNITEEIEVLSGMTENLDINIDVDIEEESKFDICDLGLDAMYENKSHGAHNYGSSHGKPFMGMPGGKILYGSPIKSMSVVIDKKVHNNNDKKKMVSFDMDKIQFHEHQHNDNDDDDDNDVVPPPPWEIFNKE